MERQDASMVSPRLVKHNNFKLFSFRGCEANFIVGSCDNLGADVGNLGIGEFRVLLEDKRFDVEEVGVCEETKSWLREPADEGFVGAVHSEQG